MSVTRRRLLPLVCAALCLGAQAAAAKDDLAFVLNSADATISVIDVDTQKELRTLPVLREPHHMALSPDGHSLLIGDTSGNSIFFLDPETGKCRSG